MTRIDWLVLKRLSSRIGATVFIFYGLIALVESLDTWRFNVVSEQSGLLMALVMVAMSAVRWTIKTLPVTVLMGAILGLADLKARHELTVIKASGISIWRAVRAPTIALVAVSFVIALGAETLSTQINRELYPTPPGQAAMLTPPGEIWLEQRGGDAHYVLMARYMAPGGAELGNVTLFHLDERDIRRLEAETATLRNGEWIMPRATVRTPNRPAYEIDEYRVPTQSSPAEISLTLASTEDMTFFDLWTMLEAGVADPSVRTAATMRLIKLLALPLVLSGSLFIAFAFTAGYRRNSSLGPAVLFGIVLGFVVFVITEMADRAGSTGVLDPTFAAVGPALVAIVIGATVLLHKEDGLT
ncbi:lipopolysaccharide export system permease protein [Devosia crocina]|uniref:Lipopolysaccharide export system permease protein n=1 Tax=Devosia crocina TaxID=429728 RepID=A0A1I7NKQ7_9HYPH|nr:LptF/LptG family permease [Devosia crocina]SFV35262.1 lipopolysaccharide export system permease protein [Devosia crocina]